MKKTKWLVVSCICLLGFACWALAGNTRRWFLPRATVQLPDAKEELRKLYARYAQSDSMMDVSGSILLYDEERNNALKETTGFRLVKKGSQLYTQLGYLQTLIDGEMVVELDTLNKYITVSRLEKDVLHTMNNKVLMPEYMFGDTTELKVSAYVTGEKKRRTLHLHSDLNPDVKSCRITYDSGSYRIYNTDIEWWKQGVVNDTTGHHAWMAHIDYVYQPFSELMVADKISQVIRFSGKEPVAADRYKDYEIHNRFK